MFAFGSGLWLGLGFGCAPPLLAGVFGDVCALGLFHLYPTPPGWGVRRGCVCLGSGFGCAPPLLAGVLGCVCAGWALPLYPATPGWGVRCGCVFGLGFRLRPATPGWGVGVCVLVCTLPMYPATPGWGVRRGCVCLGSGFGCAPPLLAGVLGFVCAGVRAPLVPRHSWLGCAVWVCVFGLGFRLRPATPGWGVGVCVLVCTLPLYPATPGWGVRRGCVCLGSGFGCAPPLLAGVLGCVCAGWALPLYPATPGWGVRCGCVFGLGFRLRPATPGWGVGVWVLVCTLPLYPATPGWGVRRGCVCLGSGFGCAPPLLAGVLGFVCAGVRAPLVPCHSWLGCAVWLWVFGLRLRLRPATPGWGVGVCVFVCVLPLFPATPGWGVRCGCVCSGSGFGCAPPLLAGVLGFVCAGVRAPLVPRHSWLGCGCWCARSPCTPPLLAGVCGVGVCAWARVSAAPRHSWLGGWGLCVLVCALRLYPASPGWGVRRGCVCLGSGFGCAPPLLAGVLGCVSAGWALPLYPATPGWGVRCGCVFGLWFRLRPATPGWGVGVCVLVCTLPLYPATPGWGVRRGCVCLGSGFGCAPPLLAGVLRFVCAGVRAPLVRCHSWLGCAVWLWVFGLDSGCAPPLLAGVLGCACLCACSPCSRPLLAGVCGVGVCARARVSVAPRHSWLGCWGVCVLVFTLRLYPATPGWGVRPGCVCSGSGFGCAPPLLAGVLGCACLCACSPCTPPLLAGVCGVGVCVWVWVSAAPRHSSLGCWGVCVLLWALSLYPATPGWGVRCGWWFGLGFRLRPATPGWGVGVCVLVCALPVYPATPGWGVRRGCVCLGSGSGSAPPLRAGVLGFVCAGVRAPLVPRHSWLGCALWVFVFGLGFRLRPATPGWGVGGCVCLCACSACTPPLLAWVCGLGVCAWARVSAAPRHSWLGCWGVCLLVFGLASTPPLLAGVCGVGACVRPRVSAAPRHSWLGFLGVCVLVCVLPMYPATPGWGVRCGCVCSGSGFRLRPATPGWGVWCVGWLLPGTCCCAVVRCVLCALPGFAAPGGRCGLAPVLVPWLWPAACLSGVPRGPALVRRASSGPVALGAPVGFPVAVVPFPTPGACAPGFTGWLRGARGGRPRTGLIVPAAGPHRGRGAGLAPRRTRSGPRDGVVPGGSLRLRSWAACAAVFGVCGPVTDASGFPYRPSFDGGLGRCTGAVSCGRRHRPFRVGGRHARVPRVSACACPAWPGRAGRPPGRVLVRLTFPLAGLGALFAFSAPSGLGLPCLWLLFGFFFFFFPPCRAPVVSFACFPARGALGLGVFLPPPPLFFFFFSLSSLVAPPLSPALRVFRPGVPWALASCCPPPPLFFFFLFSFSPFLSLAFPGVSVVLSLSGRAARRPGFGVVCLGVPLPCVVFCCAVLWCGGVLSCSAVRLRRCLCLLFVSCRCVSAVCGLGCCAVCSLSSPPCAVLCWCPFVVLCASSVLFLVAGVVGSWCRCLLFGVCWWLWLPGVVVWWCVSALVAVSGLAVARRLPCGVLLPCVVSCGLCFRVVLCCGALSSFFFFFFLLAGGAGFLLFLVGSGLRAGSGLFLFLCSACAVLCWCACVVALCAVLSCPCGAGWCFVLLPVVFACLLLGLAVLCCLLVGPGGFWCRVSVACCGVSLGAVLRRVAARCAAWRCVLVRCVVSFCSVWCCRALCRVLGRCPSSWGPVPSGVVFCLVPPRCVCFAVVCRCVVLFAVVLCAVCVLGCRVVRFLSSPPCAVLLCGPLSLGALLPCAVPRGAVLSRGVVVSCPAALLGLFLAWVWLYLLEKPLQNFLKYFVFVFSLFWLVKIKKNYTRPNTLACSKTMYAVVSYVLPVVLDVLGLVLVLGVVERVGVHC